MTGSGHSMSTVSPNVVMITGSTTGSDIITVRASITYQGLTYTASYTINKITAAVAASTYQLVTSTGSLIYDPLTSSYIPSATTKIIANALVSIAGAALTPYAGRFTVRLSSDGGGTYDDPVYTSTFNQSSYGYPLTGVTTSTTNIRFMLHVKDETPSNTNILAVITIPVIVYGYTGSGGSGSGGKAVTLYTGSASMVTVYGVDGYISSSDNATITDTYTAVTNNGFLGTIWYQWSKNASVVSAWSTTNDTYDYTRNYYLASMPEIVKVEVGDGVGYDGSSVAATDYVTVVGIQIGSGDVVASISNDMHTIPIDINTDEGDYTNSGFNFWVFEEENLLTFKSEAPTYPVAEDVGTYNVQRSYINISSGGDMTGMNTTMGTVPDHTNLTSIRATVTVTFRVRKLDGSTATEIIKFQTINRSSIAGDITLPDPDTLVGYIGSGLLHVVDFTDLPQTFWPGTWYAGSVYSGSMAFGTSFAGQTITPTQVGNEWFDYLSGLPSSPLALAYTGSVGVANNPLDHNVIFGISTYTP